MDPQIITAIASIFSSVVLLVTAIILVLQAREIRRATYGQSFKTVYDILQTDDVRVARWVVLHSLKDKEFALWTDEEKQSAEKVCHTYDSVAIMVRNGMIPIKVVADSWGDSLRRTWRILVPLIGHYRAQRNSAEFWDDYEWLARKAEKFRKTVHTPD